MFSLERVLIPNNTWCVYAHYDLNGVLAYIGMGAPHRPMTRERRTRAWHDALGGGFYVSILSWHKTKESAATEEKRAIKELKPPCNMVHTGRVHPKLYGNTWNVGRKHTQESKRIMAEKQKASWDTTDRRTGVAKRIKPIKCIETGVIYRGLRDASRQTGFCPSHLSNVINGIRPHAGGYHFTREF